MIQIKSPELNDTIKNILETETEEFSETDLLSIREIYINPVSYSNKYSEINLDEVLYLKNLQVIEFHNTNFDNQSLTKLATLNFLDNLAFYDCSFESLESLTKLNILSLTLNSCSIDDAKIINNFNRLKKLNMECFEEINLSGLDIIKQLRCLSLMGSIVNQFELIAQAANLEEIRLDNTDIKDLSPLLSLDNLKSLIISRYQVLDNKETIQKLIDKKVIVTDEMNQNLGDYNE